MGRIVAQVQIAADTSRPLTISGLVDTGAAYLTLPMAWKARFDAFASSQAVEVETASQETVVGEVCGPVRIEIEGFRPIYSEVMFIDMHPENGVYEPLLGYLPLEQSQAAVDMVGHRLVHARRIDLKRLAA
jgi:predicted aspartyl protease